MANTEFNSCQLSFMNEMDGAGVTEDHLNMDSSEGESSGEDYESDRLSSIEEESSGYETLDELVQETIVQYDEQDKEQKGIILMNLVRNTMLKNKKFERENNALKKEIETLKKRNIIKNKEAEEGRKKCQELKKEKEGLKAKIEGIIQEDWIKDILDKTHQLMIEKVSEEKEEVVALKGENEVLVKQFLEAKEENNSLRIEAQKTRENVMAL